MQLCTPEHTPIRVNGAATATAAATLAELLAELGYAEGEVATAVNGAFIPRSARGQARLFPEDAVEIVAPRQGG